MLFSKSILSLLALTSVTGRALDKRWQDQCTSFKLPAIPEQISATITGAQYYAAGTVFNQSDPFGGPFVVPVSLAFCRIILNVTTYPGSKAVSEVWLPDAWNNRFLGAGNGGSGGSVNWADLLLAAVAYGFAGHATNGGHSSNSSDASWALGNPEALVDWHYRALHQGTVAAKAIIASYYSAPKFNSYYAGCSAGGRQALLEAQRYPTDYDAILAGSPGYDDVRQSASALFANQKVLPVNGSTWFSNDTWTLVYNEVMKQCDAMDGVVDGVLNAPHKCNFRPAAIACRPGQNNATCLTSAQLGVLQYIYEPWKDVNDTYVWAGFAYGAELDFVIGNLLPDGGQYGQDGDFFRYFVYNDSNWQVNEISYQSVVLGASTVGIEDTADNPDMSAFVARGGKLLQYAGWNDQYISPYASIHWLDTVDDYMSSHTNYTTDDYYRLFLVPGMQHCLGGNGPVNFGQSFSYAPHTLDPKYNIIQALVNWYENGQAPDTLIGTAYQGASTQNPIAFQRPICQWPKTSVYKGSGDINKAENFECVL